jgi:hypothetical protein
VRDTDEADVPLALIVQRRDSVEHCLLLSGSSQLRSVFERFDRADRVSDQLGVLAGGADQLTEVAADHVCSPLTERFLGSLIPERDLAGPVGDQGRRGKLLEQRARQRAHHSALA